MNDNNFPLILNFPRVSLNDLNTGNPVHFPGNLVVSRRLRTL